MIETIAIILAVLLVLDWLQTVSITRSPGRWRERNPIIRAFMRLATDRFYLPEHGVHVHFAMSAACITAGAVLTPAPWSLAWLAGWAVAEAVMVVNNHRLGIRPARL